LERESDRPLLGRGAAKIARFPAKASNLGLAAAAIMEMWLPWPQGYRLSVVRENILQEAQSFFYLQIRAKCAQNKSEVCLRNGKDPLTKERE